MHDEATSRVRAFTGARGHRRAMPKPESKNELKKPPMPEAEKRLGSQQVT
jgi:hypothetical protein